MMTMIQFIQKECDRQAREIFQHFREHRDFDLKVINSFHFTYMPRHGYSKFGSEAYDWVRAIAGTMTSHMIKCVKFLLLLLIITDAFFVIELMAAISVDELAKFFSVLIKRRLFY